MSSRKLFFLFSMVLASVPLSARSLVLESFHADIRVFPDGEIEVTETLRPRFEGSWNGIYRFIPVEYRTPQGFSYRLWLNLESVTDTSGADLRHESFRERHYQKFQIWVPGAINTTKTVVIRYRVRRALRFFDEHDEFYWNVTGDEGAIPIESSSARIRLPEGVTGVRVAAFTGPYGSLEQAAETQVGVGEVVVRATRSLRIREGLTVAVAWDPGIVARPTRLDNAVFFLSNNWFFLFPVLVFAFMCVLWSKRGRDPQLGTIVPQYSPPEGMSPAEVGTLIDHSPDIQDITATLVDLAVRGHLRIEEVEEEKFWGLWSKTDYRLERTRSTSEWDDLKPHEKELLEGLFSGRQKTVLLSELQNQFYKKLPGIRDQIFDALVENDLYSRRPDKVKRLYVLTAVVLGGLAVGAGAGEVFGLAPLSVIVPGVLAALIVIVFGLLMPARTVAGARKLEHILGFQEFLERVESDRFKRMITGPEMFEKYLPFAMALKVDQQWAEAFAGLYTEPPSWYTGPHPGRFHTRGFVTGLNRMSTQAASVMTSAPRSSGGSGFGGGGSSGGGFGGGGTGGF